MARHIPGIDLVNADVRYLDVANRLVDLNSLVIDPTKEKYVATVIWPTVRLASTHAP